MATRPKRPASGRARPASSRQPADPARRAGSKQPASTRAAGSKRPASSGRATNTTRPTDTTPPAALRLAAAAQAAEAVGLFVAGVFAAVSTADGRSYQLDSGIALTLIAFCTAAMLAAIAVGLARARPWSRIPAGMTQLFVVIAGVTLLDGRRPEWGVPALVLAGLCVAGLLTPASLRALNRRPASEEPAAGRQVNGPPAGSRPSR
jgi:hypothetical protein